MKNRRYILLVIASCLINDQFVAEQQQVVDLFYRQKLIPKTFQVKDAVWKP